jgi:hypothetical protein
MNILSSLKRALVLGASALLLSACIGDGGSGGGTGQLSLSVTDAPVDEADAVVVTFTGVTLKPESGEAVEFDFEEPRQIDLLALTGSDSELLLDAETVPAGRYEWIRLKVLSSRTSADHTYIEIDGAPRPLWVPSGDQTGLKLVSGFTVPVNAHADFTVDFDLRKAVNKPDSAAFRDTYFLRPALRLVDNTATGALAGSIHPQVIADAQGEREACFPAVYVYDGNVTEPTDVGGPEDREPVTSTVVSIETEGEQAGYGSYEVGFLTAGHYLPVFTCDADLDDPELYDNETETVVRLLEGDVVEVVAGETTIYDFTADEESLPEAGEFEEPAL